MGVQSQELTAIVALLVERSVVSAPSLPTWVPREKEAEGRGARIEEEERELRKSGNRGKRRGFGWRRTKKLESNE